MAENEIKQIENPTLAARILQVISATSAVPKHGFNEQQRFSYARLEDVLEAVRLPMANAGVALLMLPGAAEFSDVPRPEGKAPMVRCRLPVVFRLIDSHGGEMMEIPWMGESTDIGDKSYAKAQAAAQKTFLQRTFLLPSGEDEPDSPPGSARPRTNSGPARTPPAGVDLNTGDLPAAGLQQAGVKTINDRQLAMLRAKLAEANRSDLEACEKAGVSALKLLTNAQLDKLLDWIGPRRKP